MEQDRPQELRPTRLNCNLTEGIKIAKEEFAKSEGGLSVGKGSTNKMTERHILRLFWYLILGLPRWPSGNESACQFRRCKRHGFDPWVGKSPCSRKWLIHSGFLPGKFHGQSSLAGYSPKGHTESDTTEHISSALFGRAI